MTSESTDALPDSSPDFASRATRGVFLYTGRTGIVQALQVVSSLVLARALVPTEYGAFAVATTLLAFARFFGDLGTANRLMVARDIDVADLRRSAGISVGTAVVMVILLFGLAPPLTAVLHMPHRTVLLTWLLLPTLLLDSLRTPPVVRLSRSLAFGTLGAESVGESAILYIGQISFLVAGFGVWALVIGQVMRSIGGLALMARLGGGLARPIVDRRTPALLRQGLPFQGPALLAGGFSLVMPLLISARLGAQGVGYWSWSTVLATPLTAVLTGVYSIAIPTLSRMRAAAETRMSEAEDLVGRATVTAGAIAASVLFGFAPAIVTEVFAHRWSPATGAVQATLAGLVPAAFAWILAAIVDARIRPMARLGSFSVASLCGIAALIPLMTAFGVTGAAVASAVVVPSVDALILWRIARLRVRRWLGNAALLGAVLTFASVTLNHYAHPLWVLMLLAAGCLIGGITMGVVTDKRVARVLTRAWRRTRHTHEPLSPSVTAEQATFAE